MALDFRSYSDGGAPEFSVNETGSIHTIQTAVGDKGRWAADFIVPLHFGVKYVIGGAARTTADRLRVSLVWIDGAPGSKIHSVEQALDLQEQSAAFQEFAYPFIMPTGAKSLRVELRGRAGAGLYEFKDIDIIEVKDPPDPEPPLNMITLSVIVGKTRWRITATEESITSLKLDYDNPFQAGKIYWID